MIAYINVTVAAVLVAGLVQGLQIAENLEPGVRVVITNQKYCLGQTGLRHQPPDAITLRLALQVTYQNKSRRPLIIPSFEDSTLIVNRTLSDVARRQHRWIIPLRPPRPTVNVTKEGIDRPVAPYFDVIPPFEESRLRSNEYVILPIHDPSAKNKAMDLLGRRVFLQLEFDHNKVEGSLAAKWQSYGYLWTDKVRTAPIEINIPASPVISDCSGEFRVD